MDFSNNEEVRSYLEDMHLNEAFLRERVDYLGKNVPPGCPHLDALAEYFDLVNDLCDIAGWLHSGNDVPQHVYNLAAKRIARLADLGDFFSKNLKVN